MENQVAKQEQKLTAKVLFTQDNIKKKFEDLLGKKAQGFITSILQIVANNDKLSKADPYTVYNAAAIAATLDLPINQNLGFAYIIPYDSKQSDGSYKVVAQFQMGYKGFIQLSQRSGQFKTISACPIFEGQLITQNPLTGFEFDFTKKTSETVIGYAAYFSLINGFEKTLYMTVDELKKHGVRFSKSFAKGYGLWKDDFDSMAQKTVIKLLLSKFAPLSIEMQQAVMTDQAVINNEEGTDVSYSDHEEVVVDKEAERVLLMINDATDIEQLDAIYEHVKDEQMKLFLEKKSELTPKSKK